MKNKNINSVKIIHDDLCYGTYRFLADFFRMIGTYVGDSTLNNNQIPTEYDLIIVVKDNISSENLINIQKNYENIILVDSLDLIHADREMYKIYLKRIVDEVGKYLNNVEDLKFLADIYVDEELMKARASFAYLNNEKNLVQIAQKHYLNAYIKVVEYIKDNSVESRYLDFARIHFARTINETCKFLETILIFEPHKSIRLAEEKVIKHNMNNLHIEQAFLAELDVRCSKEIISFYRYVLDDIQDKAYASYIHYRAGRICEHQKNFSEAKSYYYNAIKTDSNEFRALYKMGIFEKNEQNIDSAVRYFSRIINIFEKRLGTNYLQEFEYEYLYKAYYELALLYDNLHNYEKAQEYYMKMIQLNHLVSENNALYDEIYGINNSEIIKEYTRKRLPIGRAIERLKSIS